MEWMFYYTKLFNQLLNNWNVSNITNMDDMFSSAISFNQKMFYGILNQIMNHLMKIIRKKNKKKQKKTKKNKKKQKKIKK